MQRQSTQSSNDWTGRRVTIMGLGSHGGGLGAARFLASRGAQVTISDQADRHTLFESLVQLGDLPHCVLKLGRHDEADFRHADVVVINPAVRPGHACVELARARGARIVSEIELFLERSPAPVIGITGSNGKSTTATMLAQILQAAGVRTWLGGNIGGSLLDDLDQMAADDRVVLELSSFQLAQLSASAPLPELAMLTNCTANHLDWHGSLHDYALAKRRLLTHPRGRVILNAHDATVANWHTQVAGQTLWAWELDAVPRLNVPGRHNRENAALAAAAADTLGIDRATIVGALAAFAGLEHRIEWVTNWNGRRIYNDSKSTSPGATLAALAAIEGPLWLLAGGQVKDTPLAELGGAISRRVRGVALFGAAREALRASILAHGAQVPVQTCPTMNAALTWCCAQSRTGDAILLSPACASFDQFADYQARGRAFRELARAMVA